MVYVQEIFLVCSCQIDIGIICLFRNVNFLQTLLPLYSFLPSDSDSGTRGLQHTRPSCLTTAFRYINQNGDEERVFIGNTHAQIL